jgi:low temperature requirement protein LtrA
MPETEEPTPSSSRIAHGVTRMTGRDPHEPGRSSTALELLFDLTFVIAFGQAGNQLAHLLAEGHFGAGLFSFLFAMFAICWAWINFSWFASAYDTDDWIYRATTMVQMVGVLILALGLPALFQSIDEGQYVDNRVVVLGYIVMRVPLIFQWLRAAKQDPPRRAAAMTYVKFVSIAQVGWIIQCLVRTNLLVTFVWVVALTVIEMLGPYIAERYKGGTPWHAHHMAERYGLLIIIALGEGLIGTVATLSAVVEEQGWTLDAALVGLAGTGLTFGMWWMYFSISFGDILHLHRDRSFLWGYGHIPLYIGIAGTGAGLHVAAFYIEHEAHISATETLLTVVLPVALYAGTLYALYNYMVRMPDPFHISLILGTAAVLALAVVLSAAGASMPWCLMVLMLSPFVTVVGYEAVGHRHQAEVLERMRREA